MSETSKALWAPWRMEYIRASSGPPGEGCFLCDYAQAPDGDAENHVIWRSGQTLTLFNSFPYSNGHLMVAPRQHTADLSALDAAAHAGLGEALRRAIALLQGALRPDGMNVGLNLGAAAGAGFADHLHWHLVPRWSGDTNFMPVIAEVHCIPEHLEAMWARLTPVFAALDQPDG